MTSQDLELLDIIVLTEEHQSDEEWVMVDRTFSVPGFEVYFIVRRAFEMTEVLIIRAWQILKKVGRLSLEESLIHDSEKIRKIALSLLSSKALG